MHQVFIEIITRGILPALRIGNLWLKKTGILDNEDGSVCLRCSIPQILIGKLSFLNGECFEGLSAIILACNGRDCFELLCTSMIEATLFGMVYWITEYGPELYVFSFC